MTYGNLHICEMKNFTQCHITPEKALSQSRWWIYFSLKEDFTWTILKSFYLLLTHHFVTSPENNCLTRLVYHNPTDKKSACDNYLFSKLSTSTLSGHSMTRDTIYRGWHCGNRLGAGLGGPGLHLQHDIRTFTPHDGPLFHCV